MRHLMGPSIVLVGLVACSADDGAHLTFSAPMGPTKAASFDLVLATPDLVPAIRNQRLGPSGTAAEEVTYYLQRTTAGAESEHGSIAKVEGFTLRVEPNTGISDTAFIPFLLLHDEAGALVGIGTYHAGDSTDPAPIVVRRGEIDRYTLVIEPVTQIVDTAPLVAQEALAVSCYHADQTTWPSGIAWRTAAGRELRVLFPDQGEGTDATTRELDLDCDGHVVTPADASADCDDTRGWFHPGAVEACDGYDTNCDGSPYVVSACPQTTGGCTSNPSSGVALCDDTTGTPGMCSTDPICACMQNSATCARCTIRHDVWSSGVATIKPCQPGIGSVSMQNLCNGGSPCTVDVIGASGGWQAFVAADSTSFASRATGVGSSVLLEVKRPEGLGVSITGYPGHYTSRVDLVIVDAAGGIHYLGIPIQLEEGAGTACGAGPYQMSCTP